MIITGDILREFPATCPFASAKSMPRTFGVNVSTVKAILICELRFKKSTQRWGSFVGRGSEKASRLSVIELLKLLRKCELFDVNGVTAGDES
jgi:hypothetical protein